MLIFEDVWVRSLQSRSHAVMRGLTTVLPTNRRLGVLCASKIERRALSDLISGMRNPAVGRMRREAMISSPVGRMAGLVSQHTLRRNCIFAARMHRINSDHLIKFVAYVANIDAFMNVKYKEVPAEIATAFRYALSYGLPYDTYLVDGEFFPSNVEYVERFADVIKQISLRSGFIVISANPNLVREFCDVVAVCQDSKIVLYSNTERAIYEYSKFADELNPDLNASETLMTRIKRAFRAQDWRMLAAIAKSEMQRDPDSVTALWLHGELALIEGDRERGSDLILRACKASPYFEESWKTLCRLADEEQDEAKLQVFAAVLMLNEQCRVRRVGAKAIEQTGVEEAILEAWRKVVAVAGADVNILAEAGDRLMKYGATREAADVLAQALSVEPTNARVLMMLFRCELLFADEERLADLARMVGAVCPEESERVARLIEYSRRSQVRLVGDGQSDADVGDMLLMRIRRGLRMADWRMLSAIAESESQDDPDNVVATWLYGEIALAEGDRRRGSDLILRACQANPEIEEPWKTLVRLTEEESDEARIRLYVSALMIHGSFRIRRLAAKAIERTGDEGAILDAWRRVAEVAAEDTNILIEVGNRLYRGGAIEDAAKVFGHALAADPKNGRTLLMLFRIELPFAADDRLTELARMVNEVCPEENERMVRMLIQSRRPDLAQQFRDRLSISA